MPEERVPTFAQIAAMGGVRNPEQELQATFCFLTLAENGFCSIFSLKNAITFFAVFDIIFGLFAILQVIGEEGQEIL